MPPKDFRSGTEHQTVSSFLKILSRWLPHVFNFTNCQVKVFNYSIFPFSLWILSEAKSYCCDFSDHVLILHFLKYRFSSKIVKKSRLGCWNSFLVSRKNLGCHFKLTVTKTLLLTLGLNTALAILELLHCHAVQIWRTPSRAQAGTVSFSRVF